MDRSDVYLAVRILTMFLVGMIIGFHDVAKLLGVVSCILVWQYVALRESREEREDALQKLRTELVRDTYGSKT